MGNSKDLKTRGERFRIILLSLFVAYSVCGSTAPRTSRVHRALRSLDGELRDLEIPHIQLP